MSSIKGKSEPGPDDLVTFADMAELVVKWHNSTTGLVDGHRKQPLYFRYGTSDIRGTDVESPEQLGLFDSWNEKKHVRLLATYHASNKTAGVTLTALANVRHRSTALPAAVEFALILMSRKRRDDVLSDIMDWYPHWVRNDGRIQAYVACWWRIGLAVFGGFLDLAQRIAEVVGKFRGAK